MTARTDFERRLADFYAAEAPGRAPDWLLRSALGTIEGTAQRRVSIRLPWAFPILGARARLAIAVLVLVALAAAGLVLVGNVPPQPGPEPLSWTPTRYAEDWPVPPRSEPPTGAPDVPLARGDNTHWDGDERTWEGLEYADPIGDAGSGANAWIDIREVRGGGAGVASYTIEFAGGIPLPPTDPSLRWIAYGIVVDTNGDGIADERIGIDNMPDGSHRAWSTDLATGRTKWKAGPGYGAVYDDGDSGGSLGLDTWYPSAREDVDHAHLRYSGGSGRFYGWASMIEDGRVVASDYAPDAGWLVSGEDPGLPLVGTNWTIEREIRNNSEIGSVGMTLRFATDGQLLLDLCRRGTATVRVTPDTISLRDLTLTEKTCSAEVAELPEVIDLEADIRAVVSKGEISYTLDAGVLELRAGSEALVLQGNPDIP
jgi:hypothetical protein